MKHSFKLAELLHDAAAEHGEETDGVPTALGDLEECLQIAFKSMSHEQTKKVLSDIQESLEAPEYKTFRRYAKKHFKI